MLGAALVLGGCVATGGSEPSPYATLEPGLPQLALSAGDLAGGRVAVDITCDGAGRPPLVVWGKVPDGARELFLDLFDPDAGDFSHWLVYGIPADASRLPPLPAGAREGVNGFGKVGFGGPCPPRGSTHTYVLRVVALGEPLGLGPGATRPLLYRALAGRPQLAAAVATARYRRA